jgi:hypothetical protein
MNFDGDHDDDHDDDAAIIVTPAQSREYEEAALEKLWNGARTEPEWTALAAMMEVGGQLVVAAGSSTGTSMIIRGHFYFDQYPSATAQERLKINQLVDVVAIRASSSTLWRSGHRRRHHRHHHRPWPVVNVWWYRS